MRLNKSQFLCVCVAVSPPTFPPWSHLARDIYHLNHPLHYPWHFSTLPTSSVLSWISKLGCAVVELQCNVCPAQACWQRAAHCSGSFCLSQRATSLIMVLCKERNNFDSTSAVAIERTLEIPLFSCHLHIPSSCSHWNPEYTWSAMWKHFSKLMCCHSGSWVQNSAPAQWPWGNPCSGFSIWGISTVLWLFLPFCTLYNLQVSVGDLKPWIPDSSVGQCYSAADWASLTPPYWRTSLIHNNMPMSVQDPRGCTDTQWYKLKSCALFGPLQWYYTKTNKQQQKTNTSRKVSCLQS